MIEKAHLGLFIGSAFLEEIGYRHGAQIYSGLLQPLHANGLDASFGHLQYLKLIFVDDDPFFLSGYGIVVVDDISGKGFGLFVVEGEIVFIGQVIQFESA
jgi:hypothetical protein